VRRTEYAGRRASRPASPLVILEDRVCELGPRAIPFGGDVVSAVGKLEDPDSRRRQVTDEGWRTTLVRDHANLLVLL
jgi:hypothetical protein